MPLPSPGELPTQDSSAFELQESEVAQSCPILCDPVDCSPPGRGILQARILEWVAIFFSRSPALRADALTSEPPGKPVLFELQGSPKRIGSGGIRTHAPEETGALIQRLRPLGHATTSHPGVFLGPNYGGGNEDNGDLLQKVPCTHCYTQ